MHRVAPAARVYRRLNQATSKAYEAKSRTRVEVVMPKASCWWWIALEQPAYVIMAPFGVPVLPDVNVMNNALSGVGARSGESSPCSGMTGAGSWKAEGVTTTTSTETPTPPARITASMLTAAQTDFSKQVGTMTSGPTPLV
jgi:hypothetical protein